jgi:phage tail P2-like protein
MDNIYSLELLKILPSSISGDKNVQAVAKALDPEMQSVSRDIREALIYSRIDELPEEVVDLLAWQFHADFYEPTLLSLEKKRAIVKSAIMVHRKKGTPWAVRRLLTDLGFQVDYTEWWQFGGEPYVDRLKVWVDEEFGFPQAAKDLVMRAWDSVKSARTHLEHLLIGVWMLDDYPEIRDEADMSYRAAQRLVDAYPWRGLQYGRFRYGGMMSLGDFTLGPDAILGSGRGPRYGGIEVFQMDMRWRQNFIDTHAVESTLGMAELGSFTLGETDHTQDGGGTVETFAPLVYGRFRYGDFLQLGQFTLGDGARLGDANRDRTLKLGDFTLGDGSKLGEIAYGRTLRYGGERRIEAL